VKPSADMTAHVQEAVVIGGGVVGLAAAWHLARLGCQPLALVERFRIGHAHGSSHGNTRMTRSTYASADYAGLMRHVRDEEWPRLERAAGTALIRPSDVLFFGPDRAVLRSYAAAVELAGVAVERVPVAEARRRFPSLRFTDDAEILHDRTGGTIAAAETIRALHRLVTNAGALVREDTRVLHIDRTREAIHVVTDRGELAARRVVVAAGAWLPALVPVTRAEVAVIPQVVAYFRLGVPAPSLPSWVHFDDAPAGVVTYGLADVGRDAIRVGRHVTKGTGVADPDSAPKPSADDEAALRSDLAHILAVPIGDLLESESCLYTMTPTEDFIVDCWPGDPRVVFASACSGHGFKFAPLTGRMLAELALRGTVDLPGGRDIASLFAISGRH
jgi:sarcosine oxidase